MEDVLDTVADQGFNVLRIPLCVQLVNQWRNGDGGEPDSVNYTANPALEGMTNLQILDASIAYCKQIGLKVMLDMHRVVNTQMLNTWSTWESMGPTSAPPQPRMMYRQPACQSLRRAYRSRGAPPQPLSQP